MKKTTKNLILIFIGLIIIIVLVLIIISSKKTKLTDQQASENLVTSSASLASSTPVKIPDPAIMTVEERKAFRVDPLLKIEVLRRSATGTPTDYRIIK